MVVGLWLLDSMGLCLCLDVRLAERDWGFGGVRRRYLGRMLEANFV